MILSYWVRHGGSDSYFAAKNAKEALKISNDMNAIAMEFGMAPTSAVVVAEGDGYLSLVSHAEELKVRQDMGDEEYFSP